MPQPEPPLGRPSAGPATPTLSRSPAAAPASPAEAALLEPLQRAFAARFGPGAPLRLFFAPGRVNLMGAHLDYNGGAVMPTAIDRGTFIAARPAPGGRVRLASTLEQATFEGRLPAATSAPGRTAAGQPGWPERPAGAWFDYPLGVLREAHQAGQLRDGLDLLFGGNLPIGAGLSSSASICVGTALTVEALLGAPPAGGGARHWVAQALAAERGFVGVRCGIMDPFAVALSRQDHLLWLDCLDESLEHLPLRSNAVSIGICDSGQRRDLAAGAFNQRVAEAQALLRLLEPDQTRARFLRQVPAERFHERAAGLPAELRRRGEHIFGELARVWRARELLQNGQLPAFGALLTNTHASLRDLYEVSTPELDCLVELAVSQPGVWGSRLTGAGFGGCTVMLVTPGHEDAVAEAIRPGFAARFGREPGLRFYRGDPGPRELLL